MIKVRIMKIDVIVLKYCYNNNNNNNNNTVISKMSYIANFKKQNRKGN